MPVTLEREGFACLNLDVAFSSLSSVEKCELGKVMLVADISECVAPAELKRLAESMGQLLGVDIMEVYYPERVAKLCKTHGLTPGCSLDLANGFDFDKAEDRSRAWDSATRQAPHTVIGRTPFTYVSALQELSKCMHKDDPVCMRKFDDNLRNQA